MTVVPLAHEPVRPLLPTQTDQDGPVDGGEQEQGEVGNASDRVSTGDEIVTEEEEVIAQRQMPTPYTPSASEVAQHRADGHNPYRS